VIRGGLGGASSGGGSSRTRPDDEEEVAATPPAPKPLPASSPRGAGPGGFLKDILKDVSPNRKDSDDE
jgi:hypothetical protein